MVENSFHDGHNHNIERVFTDGFDSVPSVPTYSWWSSTYIIAILFHLLLFGWILQRLFVLPEEMLSENDVEAEIKQHIRWANDHIANGHYTIAYEQLSSALAMMGHPMPQTTLDAILSFCWASFRQAGHVFRFGSSFTIWMAQFLSDNFKPNVLHRRLSICANLQQRMVRLASSGKIELSAITKLNLSLSSVSLQEIASSIGTQNGTDSHWRQFLEDSYITTGILIHQLPLPACFMARYYFFEASQMAKLNGSSGIHNRFKWLYNLESSQVKDIVNMSSQECSARDRKNLKVFFDCDKNSQEPWTKIACIRSRELLTELLSCLTLSLPASSTTSFTKSFPSVDSIADFCLNELEHVDICLREGRKTTLFTKWLHLLRACQSWRRMDLNKLEELAGEMLKAKESTDIDDFNALQFAIVAASMMPQAKSNYTTIDKLLLSSAIMLEKNLHEDPDDVVLQFCRLMTAEILLQSRLNLVNRYDDSKSEKRINLGHSEQLMTFYLLLLDRMAPNHPRALSYRARLALVAGENPNIAERYARTALAITVDSDNSDARYRFSDKATTTSLLTAESVLLVSLIRTKYKNVSLSNQERQALHQSVDSFKQESSPSLAHTCNQLIGYE